MILLRCYRPETYLRYAVNDEVAVIAERTTRDSALQLMISLKFLERQKSGQDKPAKIIVVAQQKWIQQ